MTKPLVGTYPNYHAVPPSDALYLADALEIGSTLCLSDGQSAGICRHPTGRFCVIMSIGVAIPVETHADHNAPHDAPPLHQEKAAA